MSEHALRAGVARVDITPPVPIDLKGYARRWRPATEVRAPLTATVLVVESDQIRVALVGADLVGLSPAYATAIREAVARTLGIPTENVLLNESHTHAAPHTSGRLKIGGNQRAISPVEQEYARYLPQQMAGAAYLAAGRLEPVRVGSATGFVDLAVNRRERVDGGVRGTVGEVRTILGWNPDGACDRDVGVLRIDRLDGSPMAIVVNFACHPVVVGPEDLAVNPDFPGPMRGLVERISGATCLFLQGAAGNVLPREGFFPESGPEVTFGERLALEVLRVASGIETFTYHIERKPYGSMTPIALYRRVRVNPQPVQSLAVASEIVALPLKPIPTEEQLETERARYHSQLEEARRAGAPPEVLNPIECHVNWAEDALRQLREEGPYTSVPAFLQAFRIGDTAIVAVPGEPFSEISLAVKERSPAGREHTIFAGYSNGIISYLPSRVEYEFGGYEVDYAHHSFGLLEQVSPETEAIIVESLGRLLHRVFNER
jgi:hypothetical protein